MSSVLMITSVEKLQNEIAEVVRNLRNIPGIYVSLNKTQKSTEAILLEKGIDTSKLFFIDCVTSVKSKDDVLHIGPDQLDLLETAIGAFISEIKGEKYLLIDSVATLLIYSDENKVAKFIKSVTDMASEKGISTVAFSPKTKGEELLNKIFNFFDDVETV